MCYDAMYEVHEHKSMYGVGYYSSSSWYFDLARFTININMKPTHCQDSAMTTP